MLIDATHAEETRVVVVDGNKVEEFDFESENKRQLAGNIYLAKVTRVEPSLQAAFVDYGGNRHGFLAFSEIHPDYYQIPVADRKKLIAEEAEYARAMAEEEEHREKARKPRRSQSKKTVAAVNADDVITSDLINVKLEENTEDTGLVEVPEARDITDDSAPAPEAHEAHDPDSQEEPLREKEAGVAQDQAEETEAVALEDANNQAIEAVNKILVEEDTNNQDDKDDQTQPEFRPRKPRPRRYKIQEVVKVRQILLVQVVKEERGNKGAALTTYLSLAGRYCVLMPNTARGGGISRKITNAPDRKKLKEIANTIEVPDGAGLIIRTAGAKRTKTEIKRDYEYLLRQWEQVRDLTLKSIAPAAIYEEGDLIKRSIRDLYNREIDEILVEGEAGFQTAKNYMAMLMPTRADRVKKYRESLPLFSRFQVETFLDGMFNPTVHLKSGGYIVIGITEALVAIDVNSGKATKEGSIEETALRTNLEAAEEVARQVKLRDLAGLIVIDFIDMEERRNNASVEKRIKDCLKNDRARIQVSRISGFGLMEMSRQRLRPGMLEASTQPCTVCHGTGLTRSNDSMALLILRELEEEGIRKRSREVLVTAPVPIANYLLNEKREHITILEARYGMAVRIESDPHMISPDHKMEKFKSSTRRVSRAPAQTAITIDSVEPFTVEEDLEELQPKAENTEDQPKKKRRRRRRRGKDRNENQVLDPQDTELTEIETPPAQEPDVPPQSEFDTTTEEKSKRSRTTRRQSAKKKDDENLATSEKPEVEEKTKKPARRPITRKKVESAKTKDSEETEAPTDKIKSKEKPKRKPRTKKSKAELAGGPTVASVDPKPVSEPTPKPVSNPTPELATAKMESKPAQEPETPTAKPKPKRSGWWSRAKLKD